MSHRATISFSALPGRVSLTQDKMKLIKLLCLITEKSFFRISAIVLISPLCTTECVKFLFSLCKGAGT